MGPRFISVDDAMPSDAMASDPTPATASIGPRFFSEDDLGRHPAKDDQTLASMGPRVFSVDDRHGEVLAMISHHVPASMGPRVFQRG